MDSELALSATCYFLRVPLEIRHAIYRYLLLDPPEASLDSSYDEKVFMGLMQDAWEDKAIGEANHFPEHNENDPDPEGAGTVMLNHLAVNHSSPQRETHFSPPPAINEEGFGKLFPTVTVGEERIAGFKRKFEHEHKINRYPAILQTNHQIHNEASTLLYSSLVMEVRPGDLIFFKARDGIVEPINKFWRSCPTHIAPMYPFTGTEIEYLKFGRTMEPHVFAKLERIAFSADLNFDLEGEDGQVWPMLFVDDEMRTNREDQERFTACLKGKGPHFPPVSNIFQQFVNVLVKSRYISHLDVCLGVEIVALIDVDSEEEEDQDLEEECAERKENAATKRAMELVLEAGVLNPLKQLENVKRFSLSFDVLPFNDVEFKPKNKHLDIIRDLKEKIEGNFLAKGGSV